jgi:hypothetical protein
LNEYESKIKKGAMLPEVDYSSVNIIYKSSNGTWRGFVRPYDITYEAPTKDKVITVLREMVIQHEECLKRYDYPDHLASVPLSDDEDIKKFNEISMNLMNNLLTKHGKIISSDYYAEAKLPA